ncbi:MAG: hypothetical protein DRI26_05100 [Chloroflexi bacterium]|nr:MAG: hypothetical protein DRI26_05100 [Chloroflexota bacterium]
MSGQKFLIPSPLPIEVRSHEVTAGLVLTQGRIAAHRRGLMVCFNMVRASPIYREVQADLIEGGQLPLKRPLKLEPSRALGCDPCPWHLLSLTIRD